MAQKTNKGYSLKRKPNGSVIIVVYIGLDAKGKQIFERTTWHPDKAKTPKQNERDLETFASNFRDKVKSGKLLSGEKIKLQDYYQMWLDGHAILRLQPSTLDCYKRIIQIHILPYFGRMKLTDITPFIISKHYAMVVNKGELKHSSIKKIHAVLSSMLKTAVSWGFINSNPCISAEIPKTDISIAKEKCFTDAELRIFKKVVETSEISYQLKAFFFLALYSGVRRGELLALNWNDVDFQLNRINIYKSVYMQNGEIIIKEPKNKSSIRSIEVSKNAIEKLQTLKHQRKELCFSLGIQWNENLPIFTQEDGKIMHVSTPTHAFKKLLYNYNATAEPTKQLPIITLHGLRHTVATLAITSGNDISTVCGYLGHATPSTTLKTYTHFIPDRGKLISQSIDTLLNVQNKLG